MRTRRPTHINGHLIWMRERAHTDTHTRARAQNVRCDDDEDDTAERCEKRRRVAPAAAAAVHAVATMQTTQKTRIALVVRPSSFGGAVRHARVCT